MPYFLQIKKIKHKYSCVLSFCKKELAFSFSFLSILSDQFHSFVMEGKMKNNWHKVNLKIAHHFHHPFNNMDKWICTSRMDPTFHHLSKLRDHKRTIPNILFHLNFSEIQTKGFFWKQCFVDYCLITNQIQRDVQFFMCMCSWY